MYLRMEFDSGVGPTCFVLILRFLLIFSGNIHIPEKVIVGNADSSSNKTLKNLLNIFGKIIGGMRNCV